MGDRSLLLRRVDTASRQILKALRLNGRLERLRLAHPADASIPSTEECRTMIVHLTNIYQCALARYREAVEQAISRNPTITEPRSVLKHPLRIATGRTHRRP